MAYDFSLRGQTQTDHFSVYSKSIHNFFLEKHSVTVRWERHSLKKGRREREGREEEAVQEEGHP